VENSIAPNGRVQAFLLRLSIFYIELMFFDDDNDHTLTFLQFKESRLHFARLYFIASSGRL
jgi:hypothetical protein